MHLQEADCPLSLGARLVLLDPGTAMSQTLMTMILRLFWSQTHEEPLDRGQRKEDQGGIDQRTWR